MKSLYPFGAVLCRMRREQGFANAHSFYKGSGGAHILRLSYVNYLAVERGRSLPKVNRFEGILRALNLMAGSAQRVELVRSYLSSLLGSDALLQELDAAPVQSAGHSLTIGEEAVRQSLRHRGVNLTQAQWALLAKDADAYLCDLYLENTPGFTNIEDVAKAVDIPIAKAARAVKTLVAAGLADVSAGRARSRLALKMVNFPPITSATSGIVAAWLEKRRTFLARSKVLHDWCNVARISTHNLERLIPHLKESMHFMGIFGDAEKAADTRVYALETRIFDVFE